MKTSSLPLPNFIFHSLVGSFLTRVWPFGMTQAFPKNLSRYRLQKVLTPLAPKTPFTFALYRSSRGTGVLAKRWVGRYKNFDYCTLLNEAHIGVLLTRVQNRTKQQLPKNLKHIATAKVLKVIASTNSLIVLFEYINGQQISQKPGLNKARWYLKAVLYLRFLDQNLQDAERKTLARRQKFQNGILYPFLLTKALITHPHEALILIKAVPFWVKYFWESRPVTRLVLTHRDLHFHNLLISGQKIYLIDFQLAVLTHPLEEYVTTCILQWHEKPTRTKLLTTIYNECQKLGLKTTDIPRLFIETATHALIGNKFSEVKLHNYLSALRFGSTFNPTQSKSL